MTGLVARVWAPGRLQVLSLLPLGDRTVGVGPAIRDTVPKRGLKAGGPRHWVESSRPMRFPPRLAPGVGCGPGPARAGSSPSQAVFAATSIPGRTPRAAAIWRRGPTKNLNPARRDEPCDDEATPAGPVLASSVSLPWGGWGRSGLLKLVLRWVGRANATGVQARLHEGAVHEHEAQQEYCQCRNWPEHGETIGPSSSPRDPCNGELRSAR